MSTVYIGTSAFAAEVLAAATPKLDAVLAVTRPPSAKGRGRRLSPSPVAEAALELGIAVAVPERLGDAAEQIAALEPDAVVLCAYGVMVREPLLSRYEILNVHPSLLPRWRGAAPIERAIMAGDSRTGISIMALVAELDAGPVCAAAGVEIAGDDDFGTLSERLAALGAQLLLKALEQPRDYVPQDEAQATYAEKITAPDRLLDPAEPAAALERRVRALHPHIGARLADGLGVQSARLSEESVAAGELVARDGRLLLGATPGALELLRVKPPGGRAMDAGSYLRGHAL
ncbi:MAG TPA: methionyl-tRNA formyltransferase [Solirubrobacteraceae bacterium]